MCCGAEGKLCEAPGRLLVRNVSSQFPGWMHHSVECAPSTCADAEGVAWHEHYANVNLCSRSRFIINFAEYTIWYGGNSAGGNSPSAGVVAASDP